MTAASFTLSFDNTSDATFRAWATVIHNQLSAMGWVQTGDTGQINLATATRSTVSGANYEIWRTNDGNTTIYLKVEYVNTGGSTTPGLAVATGLATDGAGNLSGTQRSGRMGHAVAPGLANDPTPRACVISGTTGRLALALNMDATTLGNSLFLGVERAKDSAGAEVTTGAHLLFLLAGNATVSLGYPGVTGNQGGYGMFVPAAGGVPPVDVGGIACPVSNANNGGTLYGGNSAVALWLPFAGGPQNPGYNVLAALAGDAPGRDTQQTISVYGANHNYYSIGPNWPNAIRHGQVAIAATRLLMRYE